MAEAEPVIRAALPDANVPTSVRRSGVPVVHASTAELDTVVDTWLGEHADGIACVIGDPTFVGARGSGPSPRSSRRAWSSTWSSSSTRTASATASRGGRPLRRDDPGDPAAGGPHHPLTACEAGSPNHSGGGRWPCPTSW